MNMNGKAFFLLIAVACFGWAPLCAAQVEDPMAGFLQDASAARQRFAAAKDLSGWVQYRSSYERFSIQPLLVYVMLNSTAQLYCMNYADFDFDLRSRGSSRRIPNHEQVWHFGGRPSPNVVLMRSGCPYGPRHDAIFPFKLDKLYPNLRSGTYTLKLTFDPRDKSFPPTPLTTVTFKIE
jgi:hypothetical protein